MRTAASCVILPPQQLTTSRLPTQEVLQKQKTKHAHLGGFPSTNSSLLSNYLFFSRAFRKFFPNGAMTLWSARGADQRSETRYSPGMAGRRTHFVECCRKVLRAVPTATLSAPSEERREVFPRLHRDLLVKLCPLPPAGAT